MPDPTTGVTVGTSAYGILSGKSAADKAAAQQRRAGKRLDAATQRQLDMAQEQLDMEKERYARWQTIYGPIEENLGKAMSKLDPVKFAAMGIADFEKKRGEVMGRVQESLAQRNITKESGISTAVMLADKLNAAEVKAGIRQKSEDVVTEMQSNFLSAGLRQNVLPSSGYNSVQTALSSQTKVAQGAYDTARSSYDTSLRSMASAEKTMIKEAGTALADYLEKPRGDTADV